MVTAAHQSLIAETLKGMSELELESLLEEIAPHFHRNKLVPMLRRTFEFQSFDDDIDDLEGQIEDLERECVAKNDALEDIGMLCCNAKATDSAETLYNYITEIQMKTIV